MRWRDRPKEHAMWLDASAPARAAASVQSIRYQVSGTTYAETCSIASENCADHWLMAPRCHDTAGEDARVEFRVAGFDWNARWDFAPLPDTIEHSRSLIAGSKSLDDEEQLSVLTNECGWASI